MAISRTKVAVIGMGKVGTTVAYHLTVSHICDDLLLINRTREKAEAEALDLKHSLGFRGDSMKVYAGDYADCSDADIVVLAVSAPYKKGMTRLDALGSAKVIIKETVEKVMASGFHGIIINITNPVDVMTYYIQKLTGLPSNQVIGTGTALDTARLAVFLADIMEVEPRSIEAICMGEHGDSQFIPWSQAAVGGKKFLEILEDNKDHMEQLKNLDLSQVTQEVAKAGTKIMMAKGATCYGVASITARIIRAIIGDENKVIPVSAMLHGQYGQEDICMGVPVVLGNTGIKAYVEYNLTEEEMDKLRHSAVILREYQAKL